MKIIVDANIIFSGILNSNSRIGYLLINSDKYFTFIAPDFLRQEISKHYNKLSRISKMSISEIREAEFQICKEIRFISEEQIPYPVWVSAERAVAGIDENDVAYIAFSKYFRCKIWSGDKKLIKGLSKKGFTQFVSTEDLYNLREKK